jgi:hypothetical protein
MMDSFREIVILDIIAHLVLQPEMIHVFFFNLQFIYMFKHVLVLLDIGVMLVLRFLLLVKLVKLELKQEHILPRNVWIVLLDITALEEIQYHLIVPMVIIVRQEANLLNLAHL